MEKYQIKHGSIGIRYCDREKIKAGCTAENLMMDPVVVESLSTAEDALKSFAQYKTQVQELSDSLGTYFTVDEYFLVRECYESDKAACINRDICAISELNIIVNEIPTSKQIGIFHNYVDAEDALNRLGDGWIGFNS